MLIQWSAYLHSFTSSCPLCVHDKQQHSKPCIHLRQKLTKSNGRIQNVEIRRAPLSQHVQYQDSLWKREISPPRYLTSLDTPGSLASTGLGLPPALPPQHKERPGLLHLLIHRGPPGLLPQVSRMCLCITAFPTPCGIL